MKEKEFKDLITRLEKGEQDLVSALAEINASNNISDLGFAKVDHNRINRCGFPEVIYGEGKTVEQIDSIIDRMCAKKQSVLVTRLAEDIARTITKKYPKAEYDKLAKIVIIRQPGKRKKLGKTVIITAGTTDLPAALEAKYTLELCECDVDLISDTGVAGIHRLFAVNDWIREADVVIVAAGMEGALPSVIGGLVSCPVIALPTSVGYGAALNGLTALFSMLISCANGITVVNIDNGFGAGCAAVRIINLLKS